MVPQAQPDALDAPGGTTPAGAGGPDQGAGDRAVPGWSLEVTAGPNRGAVVPLEGEARLGSGLDNDIVLADHEVAEQQAVFSLEGDAAVLDPLLPGVMVDGRPAAPGRLVVLRDGLLLQAGGTVIRVHGPAARPRRARWLLAAVPVLLVAVGGAALVGSMSPGRTDLVVPPAAPAAAPAPASATAAEALKERLRAAGLADQIQVTATPGAVVAEGRVAGPVLARWSEHQVWFDSSYKGTLSLVNRVREAAPDERPNIQLRAVSFGTVPYLITATGDRYMQGSVVEGWTVEQIAPDKVVLSRNGRRVELGL